MSDVINKLREMYRQLYGHYPEDVVSNILTINVGECRVLLWHIPSTEIKTLRGRQVMAYKVYDENNIERWLVSSNQRFNADMVKIAEEVAKENPKAEHVLIEVCAEQDSLGRKILNVKRYTPQPEGEEEKGGE